MLLSHYTFKVVFPPYHCNQLYERDSYFVNLMVSRIVYIYSELAHMPIVPDKVFLEVISITLDQFKFLRDGGDYIEEGTGQKKHFEGQLFDPVVFDDSVKEFLALKKKLADYFDEKSVEDIFDYIPHVLDNYEEE